MGSRNRRYRSASEDSRDERKARDKYRRSSELIDEDRNRFCRSKNKHRRTRSPSPTSSPRKRSPREISSYHSHHRNSTNKNSRHIIEKVSSIESSSLSKPISHQLSHNRQIISDRTNEKSKKQKPNFAPTGLLAAESNSIIQADGTSIVLKYHEPIEARKPTKDEWRMYVFKGSDILETIELNRKSCWLVGREQAIVDVFSEHPSVSKQHAVIQFRYIQKSEIGVQSGRVKPYIIDLDSSNGTSLNKEEIPKSRYLELRNKDILQFAHSSREYVLMLTPKI
ncbi:Smad nuclear-interacting protein [Erysiphe necator]|uniref:Putative smad fha n=1 Tax=Uncinula necator TaxID=52586 RepID=A0A0B1P7U7_UNCNE|nr:Smad nuclear-interacting protein [Erysiphe necator]KHJ34293.1 putative smad fha [Erysiphe necator]